LNQLGIMLSQRLASGTGMPYSLHGERGLRQALDRPIDSVRPKNTHSALDASQELVESQGNDTVRSNDL